ncbi:MAG: hypothetical protein U0L15_02035 [Oscillospiraceae bacterium]|jgi:hypothetical protein|nr:hypothetical protein [Oscillospiraceae bacterium]
MNILRIFHIGADRILAKNCCVQGHVTMVRNSYLHVVKKPVRLYVNDRNTIFSHYITFTYMVDNIPYTGRLYVDLRYRCPQKGEVIDVYYDPDKPKHYACHSFGPGVDPIGW